MIGMPTLRFRFGFLRTFIASEAIPTRSLTMSVGLLRTFPNTVTCKTKSVLSVFLWAYLCFLLMQVVTIFPSSSNLFLATAAHNFSSSAHCILFYGWLFNWRNVKWCRESSSIQTEEGKPMSTYELSSRYYPTTDCSTHIFSTKGLSLYNLMILEKSQRSKWCYYSSKISKPWRNLSLRTFYFENFLLPTWIINFFALRFY